MTGNDKPVQPVQPDPRPQQDRIVAQVAAENRAAAMILASVARIGR